MSNQVVITIHEGHHEIIQGVDHASGDDSTGVRFYNENGDVVGMFFPCPGSVIKFVEGKATNE